MQVYLPALVILLLGAAVGITFAVINARIGPHRPRRDQEPYESGMPSEGHVGQRFGISFYLIAILFLIFDVEVLLLYPTSIALGELGWHAFGAIGVFIALLGVAFLYEWRRGSLNWK
jgi:NADH-quinone oxidoreductase subunit A